MYTYFIVWVNAFVKKNRVTNKNEPLNSEAKKEKEKVVIFMELKTKKLPSSVGRSFVHCHCVRQSEPQARTHFARNEILISNIEYECGVAVV